MNLNFNDRVEKEMTRILDNKPEEDLDRIKVYMSYSESRREALLLIARGQNDYTVAARVCLAQGYVELGVSTNEVL